MPPFASSLSSFHAFLLVSCSTRGSAPEGGDAAAGFANKVWQVSGSTGVAPGMLYVFLSEGTLLIASLNRKPARSGHGSMMTER